MYFKCHLAAEGEVAADRHHLSLSEMAALRKTHFLFACTPPTAQPEYCCCIEMNAGEEKRRAAEEGEMRGMCRRVDKRKCALIFRAA